MNRLIIIFAFAGLLAAQYVRQAFTHSAGGCGGSGFTTCAVITFDHTKAPNTDQSSFPALVTTTKTYLKTTGNGGSVTNASGFDVILTSDSGCTTKLNWEVENWSGSTGTVYYWVQVPTLSHTVDTVIYMCAGKASVTTDQSNKTGTWDSNFVAVYHLSNGVTGTVFDSTAAANNASSIGSTPASVTGQIFNGQNDNTTQKWQTTGSTAMPTGASISATIEAWAKFDSGARGYGFLVCSSVGNSTATGQSFALAANATSGANAAAITLDYFGGSALANWTADTTAYHHLAITTNGNQTTVLIYLDGVSLTIASNSLINFNSVSNNNVGLFGQGGVSNNASWSGSLDEVRLSKTTRSPDWIKTEYNNQSSPGTFETIVP